MEDSILSHFQLDMGLSSDSSDLDSSSGQSWRGSNESTAQREFPDRASDSEDLEFPYTPAQRCARTLSDKNEVPERELKRRKEFAAKTCTGLGLGSDVLAEFSQACYIFSTSCRYMLISRTAETD